MRALKRPRGCPLRPAPPHAQNPFRLYNGRTHHTGAIAAPQGSSMNKYVAFLRAINVGGHTVKMNDLRRLCADIGLNNVETVIASGNVVFASPARSARALEKKIAAHLPANLGYTV